MTAMTPENPRYHDAPDVETYPDECVHGVYLGDLCLSCDKIADRKADR